MYRTVLFTALAALSLTLLMPATAARADDYPYSGHSNYTMDGFVRRVDIDRDRITVAGGEGRLYRVDTSSTDIILRDSDRSGVTSDLRRGMHLHIIGMLVGDDLIEADRVRILPATDTETPVDTPNASASQASLGDAHSSATVQNITLDGIVRLNDGFSDHLTLVDTNDHRYTIDAYQSDIILPDTEHMGRMEDLIRGTRIHVVGTLLPNDVIVADRMRVLPESIALAVNPPARRIFGSIPAAVPLVVAAARADLADSRLAAAPEIPVAPVLPASSPVAIVHTEPIEPLENYTGILIDVRGLNILRSPAPVIYGAGPDVPTLYPDKTHVPTPDEVQDESVVRYYRTLTEAENGVAGTHPLILQAVSVVGPAKDSVTLMDDDAALFQALDKKLHFSRTWKVGFLIPADR